MSQTQTNKSIRSVAELGGQIFFIPAYQRGYRWASDEVKDLLNDIQTFAEIPSAGGPNRWYCLQPLVVRSGDNGWEVIDGQQRLTTVFLISRYIREMWPEQEMAAAFALEYESRKDTSEFLQQLRITNGTVTIHESNIDFYYISTAYQAISDWACKLKNSDHRKQFTDAFRDQVRVIWHEPTGSNGTQIFTRINQGKIPLTNAELIKALFLKKSNFQENQDEETIRLQQLEISGDWDRMEAALHDDAFWYFLTSVDDNAETRIDLIFRMLTGDQHSLDAYAVFRAYNKTFPEAPTSKEIRAKWNEVIQCFQTLEDWFRDWELYHEIGFLISIGINVLQELWQESKNRRKSEFRKMLTERIRQTLPEDLDSLRYGDQKVRNTLLFYNIATLLQSSKRESRFPFDRYKNLRQWDVEHIHSVSENKPETDRHQKEWLNEALQYLDDHELKKQAKDLLYNGDWDAERFGDIYRSILEAFSENRVHKDINDLSNLALLDAGTNRGYGNAVFPAKRTKIIERDLKGIFIPFCTRNVFMKAYSNPAGNYTIWSTRDQVQYIENIKQVLTLYMQPTQQKYRNE